MKISANILIRNECNQIDGLIKNLIEADVDEILFLDGGSSDGSYERLMQYEQENCRIKVLRWPQPKNSEYKLAFKETVRRNLLMDASKGDYILYIDADERIDPCFKQKLTGNADIYSVVIHQFWNKYIRVNMLNDSVWSLFKYRIIKNNGKFKFISFDKNGLHNHISKHGIRLYNEKSQNKFKAFLAKILNTINNVRVKNTCIKLYHLHYYNILTGQKINDLRVNDLKRQEIIVDNINDGMNYDYNEDNVICLIKNDTIIKEIEKYI